MKDIRRNYRKILALSTPKSEDSVQIQETIIKSYEIQQNASKNFDLSLFPTVFINDKRGGILSESTIDFVIDYYPSVNSKDIGWLDYKIAYYTFWSHGAAKFEELKSQAEMENRNLTSEEMTSLVDDDGHVALVRSQGELNTPAIQFISIVINKDIAKVSFDDGPTTNEMTLVKSNNSWYIAGNKIISVHP